MTRKMHDVFRRFFARTLQAPRRGTVLLLALGVLGILSIAAIAYVTIVSLDRASAQAGSRRSSYQQQPDAVVSHIGAILTADLFGNKIVSDQVPSVYWPGVFEDGDTRDFPLLDYQRANFNSNDPGQAPSPDAILPAVDTTTNPPGTRIAAYPDDAWLAATEPDWNPETGNPSATTRWSLITNLRSAYTWDSSISPGRWVRGDGRFVDLGQWFLNAEYPSPGQGFPNPGVQLMNWAQVTSDGRLGPEKGEKQNYFEYQMHEMARRVAPYDTVSPPNGTTDPLTPRDERQWADTDGDLRPDARWQQLDVLGNLFGLNWVVAARIVDASAFVNVNTALEFGPEMDLARQADGRTPADVDLLGLLGRMPSSQNLYSQNISPSRLYAAFDEWVNEDLDITGILADARAIGGPSYFSDIPDPVERWTPRFRLRQSEREAFYRYFAASPQSPRTTRGSSVPIRDLTDLWGFAGTNSLDVVSRTEQRFDGPAVEGFLPGAGGSDDFGPMRSREEPQDVRQFATAPETPDRRLPTSQQLKESRRRLLTTISGDAPFSPVPVLNTRENSPFRSKTSPNLKLPLDKPLDDEGVRRAFEAFAWALAPLAVDTPQARLLAENSSFNLASASYHYGGDAAGVAGAASALGRFQRFSPRSGGWDGAPPDDASFAIVTAASLAANLSDALDGEDTPESRAPTVLRLFASIPDSVQQFTGKRLNSALVPGMNITALGTAFSHGVVPPASLDLLSPVKGEDVNVSTPGGLTVVGLERQPFLSEFTTIAVYTGAAFDSGQDFVGPAGDLDNVGSVSTQLGSAIIFELVNPWSTPINLEDYSVVIPEEADFLGPNSFSVKLPNALPLIAGGRVRFYWLLGGDSTSWNLVRQELLATPAFQGGVPIDDVFPEADPATRRIPFIDVAGPDSARPVLLVYKHSGNFPGFVVDRMAPDVSEPKPFPDLIDPAAPFAFAFDVVDNLNSQGFSFANWFQPLGYSNVNDFRLINGSVTGRLLVTSTLQRTGVQSLASAGSGGFPATILEVPNANHVINRKDGHAWLTPVSPDPDNPDPEGNLSHESPADIILGGYHSAIDVGPINFPEDHTDVGSLAKRAATATNAIDASRFPSFQLYVPAPGDGPEGVTRLNALSELHMLSCYAHTCRSEDPDSPELWSDQLARLTNWQTVGEKMGLSLNRDFSRLHNWDTAMQGAYPAPENPSDPPNPYIGTLDPTRYILGTSVNGLPDTMAVPLALRVFDCFWPSGIDTTLGQGRININTAPADVLRALPQVAPTIALGAGGQPLQQGEFRLTTMLGYRNPQQQSQIKSGVIGNSNLRRQTAGPVPGGFVTTGELAILDEWDWDTGYPMDGARRWLEAADPQNNFMGNDGSPVEMVTDYADPSYNPINDPEERLALYRAVSNIVSTRSDVFIAWFIVRGYEPALIERIPITGSSVQARLNAMNDETFKPAYESRWLVVFDRSNVRHPKDRPKVLLKVELPRATP